jgi:hypothetical protein
MCTLVTTFPSFRQDLDDMLTRYHNYITTILRAMYSTWTWTWTWNENARISCAVFEGVWIEGFENDFLIAHWNKLLTLPWLWQWPCQCAYAAMRGGLDCDRDRDRDSDRKIHSKILTLTVFPDTFITSHLSIRLNQKTETALHDFGLF